MNLVIHNPFRVAGLLSNASDREIQRQKSKVKRFAEVGKNIPSDYDFEFLEPIERSTDIVNKAFSKLEQNQDKVINSLFWFANLNDFDDIALNHLIKGNIDKGIKQWEKVTRNGSANVSPRNISSFNNLGTIKLCSGEEGQICDGLMLKSKVLNSDHLNLFIDEIADETYSLDSSLLINSLIDININHFKPNHSIVKINTFFNKTTKDVRRIVKKRLTQSIVNNIENDIELTKDKRKDNPQTAYKLGKKLYDRYKSDLLKIKAILGVNDFVYESTADNLANEIIACSVYFFEEKTNKNESVKKSIELLKCAEKIAISSKILDRISSNYDGMKEVAKTQPVKPQLDFINDQLEHFQNSEPKISNSRKLVKKCKPKLKQIKEEFGKNEFYLNISSVVANFAQSILVEVVNNKQNELVNSVFDKKKKLNDLKSSVREAFKVSKLIGNLDMNKNIRSHYEKNHKALTSIASDLNISTSNGCLMLGNWTYGLYIICGLIGWGSAGEVTGIFGGLFFGFIAQLVISKILNLLNIKL